MKKSETVFWSCVAGVVLLGLASVHGGSLQTDELVVEEKAVFRGSVSVTQQVAKGSVPSDGLILHFSFDSDESGIVTDMSGNGHNGTVHGATWTSSGSVSGGMDFDGQNDYISVPAHSQLNPVNISLAAWFRPNAGGFNANKPIVQKAYTSHSSPYYQYTIWYFNNGSSEYLQFVCNFGAANASVVVNDCDVALGSWNHVAGTYDGETMRLYLDGVLIGTNTSPSGDMASYNTPLEVAAYPNMPKASNYCFDGAIDELLIYDRALSSNEVANCLYPYNGTDFPMSSVHVASEATFDNGIEYVAPLGDVSMGEFTNRP